MTLCCNMYDDEHETHCAHHPAQIAAIERAQGDGWQDIASAPKDGKTIVLWSKYHDEPVTAAWANGRWVARWDDCSVIESQGDAWTDYKLADVPTHWRSLPDPPAPPAAEIERAPQQDGLAELRELSEKAEPGEWWVDDFKVEDGFGQHYAYALANPMGKHIADTINGDLQLIEQDDGPRRDMAGSRNLEFAAACVNHVRAELERTKGGG